MSNFKYSNINEILATNAPKRGKTLALENLSLLQKKQIIPSFDPSEINEITGENRFKVEFHLFYQNLTKIDSVYDISTYSILGDSNPPKIRLEVHEDINTYNLAEDTYKVVYNFLLDQVGSFGSDYYLFISEISPSRRELKLSLSNPKSEDGKREIEKFVFENIKPSSTLPPIVLNFGDNIFFDVINVTSTGDPTSVYVKLFEPLSKNINQYNQCWISLRVMKPYIDTVKFIRETTIGERDVPSIAGPNFEVDYDYWVNTATGYKSWTDILGQNLNTSQELIYRQLSSSNYPVKLNVDYTDFKNFIHYSSARERVENFFYKVELVEFYKSELTRLDNVVSGSVGMNRLKIKQLKDKVISGLDDFEKYLFYDSTGSFNYTYQVSASIVPYPKYELDVSASTYDILTKEGKFDFYSYTSSYAENWYNKIVNLASEFDRTNYNALFRALPEHIRDENANNQIISFVNMLGQHFDVLFLYTDHILKKNLREENPKDGMPQDLVYEVTKNFGWTLTHGTQAKDLWEYALGLSGSGEPLWTGKTTTNKYFTRTYEERTKEVWRRILNNLPYIYKTKGTERGIRALLAAYGIPQTLLSIREFGGPDNADFGVVPRTQWNKHTYYLNLVGSLSTPLSASYVSVPWERVNNEIGDWQYPDTVTLRWKMESGDNYSYLANTKQTLLQKQSGSRVDWFVVMDKNGTENDKGSLTFYIGDGTTYTSASFYNQYFYDDVPLNLMIRRNISTDATGSDQIYEVFVKTEKYGKLVIEQSSSIIISGSLSGSYNNAWASDGTLYIGSGSNIESDKMLSGSIFELRYWTKPLVETAFNNHTLGARSYNGNTPTSSFYDLQAQFKFWQKFDTELTSSIVSSHPDQTKKYFYTSPKTASLFGFNYEPFESFVETYNMEVATIGNNTPFTEKVRLDSGSLIGGLSKDMSSEVSKFDKFSLDSNKLMIAFSPQHIINEDIYESIGYTELDDYFGEYSNVDKDEYPRLKWFAREYWKKYDNRNDFGAYIKMMSVFDFGVFDQIRQTLPARVNEILGLVIEPNILERSKVSAYRNFTGEPSENFVRRANEISSSGIPSGKITSNKTTLFVGFEKEITDYQEISGESDIPFEIEGNRDVSIAGDHDPKVTPTSFAKIYSMTISSSRGSVVNIPKSSFKPYNATIGLTKLSTGSFETSYNRYFVDLSNPPIYRVIGEIASGMGTGERAVFAPIDTSFTTTYVRENIKPLDPNLPVASARYRFQTDADPPASGEIYGFITASGAEFKVSEIDYNSNNLEDEFNNIIPNYSHILIKNQYLPGYDFTFIITSTTDNGSYRTFGIEYVSGPIDVQGGGYWDVYIYGGDPNPDVGYGPGWAPVTNETGKSIALFETLQSYRQHNHYSNYNFNYLNSRDMAERNYDSYTLSETSNYENPDNLPTSIRNHRFDGSKITGPDINVPTRSTPDAKPVVEVFIVDPNTINIDQNFVTATFPAIPGT